MSGQRGIALCEAIPLLGLLLPFLLGLLLIFYLAFARAWIHYHGEQALYCVLENQPTQNCRRQFLRRVQQQLPWGEFASLEVFGTNSRVRIIGLWRLKIWQELEWRIPLRRELKLGSQRWPS